MRPTQETVVIRRDTGDGRQETGDRRRETAEGRRETVDGRGFSDVIFEKFIDFSLVVKLSTFKERQSII